MIEKLFLQKRIFVILAVFFILVLAFFLRVYFSYDIVFSDPIKYAGDDGVYHMRIVENMLLGDHFPQRIFFDPYTNFPKGTFIHFGPLYDYLLAFLIWFLTLGNPTQKAIDLIAPFYPPILGVLAVLVVFLIGRLLWGNIVGLIAGIIAAISPNLIFRSLLGATDHHVAEYLFSSLAILCLIYLLKFQEKEGFYSIKWWFLTVLTGVALGVYFLVWEGALLFLLIFFLFFSFYFIQQYLLEKAWRHILLSGAVIFFIVFLMLLPFFGHPNLVLSPLYNLLHLGSIFFSLLFFLSSWILGELFSRRKIEQKWFLPALILAAIFLMIFIYFFSQDTFYLLLNSLKAFNESLLQHEKARELVSEMRPIRAEGTIDTFLGIFFFSLAGLIVIIYNFVKKRTPVELLLIIWFLITFIITGIFPFFGQIKYIYYLWVTAALLSALFLYRAFVFGWKGLKIVQEENNRNSPLFSRALIGSLLIIFFIFSFFLYPFPFNFASSYPNNLPLLVRMALQSGKNVIQHHQDYYQSFRWLAENTPTSSLSYYSLYQEPAVNSKEKNVFPYDYPQDSYGVLARWDLGHAITYYAKRPVVSNPFQQGIGRKKDGQVTEVGEGVFFLETNEKKAIEYLDQLKVRYLITDSSYAHPDIYFKQIIKWVQGDLKGYTQEDIGDNPSKFDNSMIARLHLLDGRSSTAERKKDDKNLKFDIEPLTHFRLIYESETTSLVSPPQENIKLVKIFEYVKGAKIIGKTKAGSKISISTEVMTNQKRKFIYEQKVETLDGHFEFVVPYSTFVEPQKLKDHVPFVVFAKPYKIKTADKEIELAVSEDDILRGRILELK